MSSKINRLAVHAVIGAANWVRLIGAEVIEGHFGAGQKQIPEIKGKMGVNTN